MDVLPSIRTPYLGTLFKSQMKNTPTISLTDASAPLELLPPVFPPSALLLLLSKPKRREQTSPLHDYLFRCALQKLSLMQPNTQNPRWHSLSDEMMQKHSSFRHSPCPPKHGEQAWPSCLVCPACIGVCCVQCRQLHRPFMLATHQGSQLKGKERVKEST